MLTHLNASSDWLNLGVMGVALFLIAGLACIGQLFNTHTWSRWVVYSVQGLLSLVALGMWGLLEFAAVLKPGMFSPVMHAVAGAMGLTGGWGVVSLVPHVRRGFSQTLLPNLDPKNPVHTWSLFIFGAAVVYTALSIFWLYSPQIFLDSFQSIPLPITVVFTAFLFVGFSLFASGPGVNGGLQALLTRLGVTALPWKTVGLMTLVALGLTIGLECFERTLLPHLISPEMQATLKTIMAAFKLQGPPWMIVVQAMLIGLGAGIGEEILFRGLVQSLFGILPTALLFALIHIHYGPTILLAELFVIGCVLGVVRRKYNTTAAIVVHTCFDFFALTAHLILPPG